MIVWEDLHGDSCHMVGHAPLGGYERGVGERFTLDAAAHKGEVLSWCLYDRIRLTFMWFPTLEAAQAEAERQLTYPQRRRA